MLIALSTGEAVFLSSMKSPRWLSSSSPLGVGERPGDRRPDPPGGVGRKLVPPPVLELVDRLHQTDVPLLDEVEELQPPVGVFLGDRHTQAEVRLHPFPLRLPGLAFALFHQPQRLGEIAGLQARLPLHAADLLARFPDDFLHAEKTILGHLVSHGSPPPLSCRERRPSSSSEPVPSRGSFPFSTAARVLWPTGCSS